MKFWERWQDGTRLKQSNWASSSGRELLLSLSWHSAALFSDAWTEPLPLQQWVQGGLPVCTCAFWREGHEGIIYDIHFLRAETLVSSSIIYTPDWIVSVISQFSFSVLTGQKVPRPVCECFEYIGVPVLSTLSICGNMSLNSSTVVSTQTLHPVPSGSNRCSSPKSLSSSSSSLLQDKRFGSFLSHCCSA